MKSMSNNIVTVEQLEAVTMQVAALETKVRKTQTTLLLCVICGALICGSAGFLMYKMIGLHRLTTNAITLHSDSIQKMKAMLPQ